MMYYMLLLLCGLTGALAGYSYAINNAVYTVVSHAIFFGSLIAMIAHCMKISPLFKPTEDKQ